MIVMNQVIMGVGNPNVDHQQKRNRIQGKLISISSKDFFLLLDHPIVVNQKRNLMMMNLVRKNQFFFFTLHCLLFSF